MNKRHASRLESGRSFAELVTYIAALVFVAFSSTLSTGYMAGQLVEDGLSAMDVAIIFVVWFVLFGLLTTLATWGHKVIPHERPAHKRNAMAGLYFAGAFAVAILSGGTSFLYMAAGPAQNLAMQEYQGQVRDAYETRQEASARLNSIVESLEPALAQANTLERLEVRTGGVSLDGSGNGKTAAQLASLVSAIEGNIKSLKDGRSIRDTLMRNAKDKFEQLGRLADNDDLTWAERQADTIALGKELADNFDDVNGTLLVDVLQGAINTFTRDYERRGLNAGAAARIADDFEPYATILEASIGDIRAARDSRVPVFEERKLIELVAEHMDELWLIGLFCFLLEFVPMLTVGFLLITYARPDDEDERDQMDPPATGRPAPAIVQMRAQSADAPHTVN